MKVLWVHNAYRRTHVGGEDVQVQRQVSLLAQDPRIDFQLYTVSNEGTNAVEAVRRLFSAARAREIADKVAKEGIDIVHVHNDFPLITPAVYPLVKAAGATVFHTLHNYRPWCISGTFLDPALNPCMACVQEGSRESAITKGCYQGSALRSFLVAKAYQRYDAKGYWQAVDYHCYLSNTQKRTLIESLGLPEKKLLHLPNGVPAPHKRVSPSEKTGLVFVGRLSQDKGRDHLLALAQKLPPEIELRVVGYDSMLESYRKAFAGTSVQFLGRLSPDETVEVIARSKYLLQLSLLEETFGLTIIEAMQAGTPVIGFPIGTRAEFIQSGINGFLTPPEALQETVLEALSTPHYERLSQGASDVGNHYTLRRMHERLVTLYGRALSEEKETVYELASEN